MCNAATLANRIETNANCDLADHVFLLLMILDSSYLHSFDYVIGYFRNERENGYKLWVQCFVGSFGWLSVSCDWSMVFNH